MDTNEKIKAFESEEQDKRVRERLNRDKIKLWEPPYTNSEGVKGDTPNELIDKYSAELELSTETVTEVLERLRGHAVEKLAARTKFQKTGVATLKVKLAGCVPEKAKEFSKNPGLTLEIDIKVNGLDLKHAVSVKTEVEVVRLKVISGGRVIDDEQSLQEQGVKNQAVMMALCLTDGEVAARRKQDMAAKVVKTKQAAELLSSKDDDGDGSQYYLQVADQTGKKLNIPAAERKALVLAMTLHEKARAAIRKQDYGEALLLLIEADGEFKHCHSELLTGVDNYALVCLDIVWCYLCLKSLRDLPDAEQRLRTCDECLRRSYGPNLERLAVVKGETGIERALFMRLHLLQAITAFHKGQAAECAALLNRVEREMSELQVDEASMTQVMAMGFTPLEARLSLRACSGNVANAVSHIMKKRQDKKERLTREKEEKRMKRIQKRLGRTADGSKVNVASYETLQSMGFRKGAAAEALRQANNDMPLAIQVLQENPALLELPDPVTDKVKITEELLAQVTMMGFTGDSARLALERFTGDVQRAVEELLKCQGEVPPEWADLLGASSSGSSSSDSTPAQTPEEREREKQAIEEIVPDIAEDEEAHLDFTLEEEANFLNEYRSLLASLQ